MKTESATSENDPYEYVQDLLRRAHDAHQGYAKAAKLTESTGLGQLFAQSSDQRAIFALELEGLLRQANIEPVDSGTLVGKVHQGWMAIVSNIGEGEENLLSECKRGEETALTEYQDALDSMELPLHIAGVVERQRDRVKSEIATLENLEKSRKESS